MEKEQFTTLVRKSQSGDQAAMEELLGLAHTSVSYQCRKMLKNAQDAEDLTQEILLTIYSKLDTLQDPEAFRKWANHITVTRCINFLNRTHVELQIAEDEEGHSLLDNLEELDEQVVPDKAIDNAETARMVSEIVESLPDAQRVCTLMFYYDEMSVKEIAKAMQVPENTVKSRLNYARKAIKEKVLDYEKQGVKLYGLSPLPFLLYFLRMGAEMEKSQSGAAMISGIMAGGGAAAGASTGAAGGTAAAAVTAGGASGGAAATAISAKLIAGILACTLGVGGMVMLGLGLSGNLPLLCRHEWKEAGCIDPKTCAKCGETEGEALGHIWADATCTSPKTCTRCAATDGEALGHTWVEATCETPKTCTVCQQTEGEALGHTWVDANFQTAKTCSVCSTTEGEPLVPGYVAHGLDARLLDKAGEYDFTTHCYTNGDMMTTGKLTVENYQTFASDETHEALEGYEWKTLTIRVRFSDNNARQYGIAGIRYLFNDYYYEGKATEQPVGAPNRFDVDWNGVNYSECLSEASSEWTNWQYGQNGIRYMDFVLSYTYRVPVGYDGCVVGISDATMEFPIGTYLHDVIDDTARMFRLD